MPIEAPPPRADAMAREPLFLHSDNWRSRWLVLPTWERLHRVSEIEWDDPDDGLIHGEGVTVCGRRGWLQMPGIFSRMGLDRCAHCCDALGLPRGRGTPFNAHIPEPGDQEALFEDVR